MRKTIVLALVLTLILSLSAMAFADSYGPGDKSIDVKGKYQNNTVTPTVYSVDVSWGTMQFTYAESGTKVWNPENHTYSDNTSASWVANGNSVTVVNHSNAAVTVSFGFAALRNYNTVTGTFDVGSKTLPAGVVGQYDNAARVTSILTLGGTLAESVADFTKVGTITVRIA